MSLELRAEKGCAGGRSIAVPQVRVRSLDANWDWEHSRSQKDCRASLGRADVNVCPYAVVSALKTCDSWSR